MEYTVCIEKGLCILRAVGDLKTSEAMRFQTQLLNCLSEHSQVILDMQDVTYICSAGLRALLAGQQFVDNSSEGDLILRNLTPEVESVIKATGFNNVLTIEK